MVRLLTLVLLISISPAFSDEVILLRDDPPTGERMVVELRELGPVRLDKPLRGSDTETELTDFDRLLSLRFFAESDESGREEVGTIVLVSDAETDDWDALVEGARGVLSELGPEAARAPIALMGDGGVAPFEQAQLETCGQISPLLACVLDVGGDPVLHEFRKRIERTPQGENVSSGSNSFSTTDLIRNFCAEMDEAAWSTPPDIYRSRTLIDVRRTLRVLMEQEGSVPSLVQIADLLPRPEGLQQWRTEATPGLGRSTHTTRNQQRIQVRVQIEGVETLIVAEPIHLGPVALDRPSFLQRWTIERIVQPLGVRPGDQQWSSETVVAVFFPLAPPPRQGDDAPAPEPFETVHFSGDFELFLDRVAEELSRREPLDSTVLMEAFDDGATLTEGDDYLIALCPEDFSRARYVVYPFGVSQDLRRSSDFCLDAHDAFD